MMNHYECHKVRVCCKVAAVPVGHLNEPQNQAHMWTCSIVSYWYRTLPSCYNSIVPHNDTRRTLNVHNATLYVVHQL